MTTKKGSRSLDEYIGEFELICDNLAAIKEPVYDLDKVFQFARGLDQNISILSSHDDKMPFPFFNPFVLTLQGHKQTVAALKEEEKFYIVKCPSLLQPTRSWTWW